MAAQSAFTADNSAGITDFNTALQNRNLSFMQVSSTIHEYLRDSIDMVSLLTFRLYVCMCKCFHFTLVACLHRSS